uniref:Capsid protein n=1 Tax=Leptomonas pyrrhocoris ostravirus TaxID=3070843 RepID=A0AA50Q9F0_9VIRU|nr:hypothetical protein [Leptomonas pyrrhocoris ostravirus]
MVNSQCFALPSGCVSVDEEHTKTLSVDLLQLTAFKYADTEYVDPSTSFLVVGTINVLISPYVSEFLEVSYVDPMAEYVGEYSHGPTATALFTFVRSFNLVSQLPNTSADAQYRSWKKHPNTHMQFLNAYATAFNWNKGEVRFQQRISDIASQWSLLFYINFRKVLLIDDERVPDGLMLLLNAYCIAHKLITPRTCVSRIFAYCGTIFRVVSGTLFAPYAFEDTVFEGFCRLRVKIGDHMPITAEGDVVVEPVGVCVSQVDVTRLDYVLLAHLVGNLPLNAGRVHVLGRDGRAAIPVRLNLNGMRFYSTYSQVSKGLNLVGQTTHVSNSESYVRFLAQFKSDLARTLPDYDAAAVPDAARAHVVATLNSVVFDGLQFTGLCIALDIDSYFSANKLIPSNPFYPIGHVWPLVHNQTVPVRVFELWARYRAVVPLVSALYVLVERGVDALGNPLPRQGTINPLDQDAIPVSIDEIVNILAKRRYVGITHQSFMRLLHEKYFPSVGSLIAFAVPIVSGTPICW